MKTVAISTLVIIAQLVFSAVSLAAAPASSGVSGVIWLDENGNGIFEPSEPTVPDAVVNVRGEGEDFIQSVLVGDDGYFEIRGLSHGLYHVWAEMDGTESESVVVEINEVSPVTVIDIAFTPETDTQVQHQIWIPVAAR